MPRTEHVRSGFPPYMCRCSFLPPATSGPTSRLRGTNTTTRVALKKKAKRPLTPNSVGEAMLFGCPAVSSCVGDVPDMLEHGREGVLYQASAPYMLAFRDDELAMRFSKAAHEEAARTHDRERNLHDLSIDKTGAMSEGVSPNPLSFRLRVFECTLARLVSQRWSNPQSSTVFLPGRVRMAASSSCRKTVSWSRPLSALQAKTMTGT